MNIILFPSSARLHVAYIPGEHVIGLSKINCIVQYYAKRPQVQERLTIQIAAGLKEILHHDDIAVNWSRSLMRCIQRHQRHGK